MVPIMGMRALVRLSVLLLPALCVPFAPVAATGTDPEALDELRTLLLELKAEQARIGARIEALEAELERSAGSPPREAAATAPPLPAEADAVEEARPSRLRLSGDVRLRYEGNFGDADAPARNRGAMRARLRAEYSVLDNLVVGAELATGSSDDPNSTDVTLSNFVDDLEVSLSRAFARYSLGPIDALGGKFANPFRRTDLVWDGDVNPQGAALVYSQPLGAAASLRAAGLYFLVDEAVAGPDSTMIGGQLALEAGPHPDLRASLAAGYYDYRLDSLAGADAGDFRSNLRDGAGGYLSDFDLVDVIAALTYGGLGERWPLSVTGNYVTNLGAATAEDTGFAFTLTAGRTQTPGDWRLGYGYMQAEVDAVLAAFSHDNLAIATNYRAHSLTLDFVPANHLTLNATLYRYRPLDMAYAGTNTPDDWLERLRLNLMVSF